MKKIFLIFTLILLSFTAYSNEVKADKIFPSLEKLDSIKTVLNRTGMFINLNLPGYKGKTFMYETFIKTNCATCTKYETIIFNENEEIAVNVLFYTDGNKFITFKNLKEDGVVKYKLN